MWGLLSESFFRKHQNAVDDKGLSLDLFPATAAGKGGGKGRQTEPRPFAADLLSLSLSCPFAYVRAEPKTSADSLNPLGEGTGKSLLIISLFFVLRTNGGRKRSFFFLDFCHVMGGVPLFRSRRKNYKHV